MKTNKREAQNKWEAKVREIFNDYIISYEEEPAEPCLIIEGDRYAPKGYIQIVIAHHCSLSKINKLKQLVGATSDDILIESQILLRDNGNQYQLLIRCWSKKI